MEVLAVMQNRLKRHPYRRGFECDGYHEATWLVRIMEDHTKREPDP